MIYCAFIGSFKEKRFQQLATEYHRRLERLWPVTLLELPENPKGIAKFIENKKGRVVLVSLD
ncbi:MAG TPA: hypothetical protein VIJ93_13305, partial [bacterium]